MTPPSKKTQMRVGIRFGSRLAVVLLAVALLCTVAQESAAAQPKKVIYETDMCLDVDDVGGLAMLHALADQDEVEILAVTFNEVHPSGAAAIDAINTWYGRGGIPVGIYKGTLAAPDTSKYLGPVAAFPHDLTRETAPTSLEVYRKVVVTRVKHYVLKDGKPWKCKAGGLGYLEPEFGNKFPSPFFYLPFDK